MFFIERDGKRSPPLTAGQLSKMAADGELRDTDLVIPEGGRDARRVAEIPHLQKRRAPDDTALPATPDPHPAPIQPCEGPADGASAIPRRSALATFIGRLWARAKVAAEIAGVTGAIGDFLQPLAPVNFILFIFTLAASCFLGAWLAFDRARQRRLDRWFPRQAFHLTSFLVVAFGGWCVLQRFSDGPNRGVLGAALPAVAQAQNALLHIEQQVAAIKQDVGDVRDRTARIEHTTAAVAATSDAILDDTRAMRIDTGAIHADTTAIREGVAAIGRQRGLVTAPVTAADHYHNAMVHVRDGNHSAAEESFKAFFDLDAGGCVDAYEQYASLVLGNYSPPRPKQLLQSLAKTYPTNPSAQLVLITATVEDDDEARRRLAQLVKDNGRFLPGLLHLQARMAAGLLLDDLARDEIRDAFNAAGGSETFKAFVLNPVEGEGQKLVRWAAAFANEAPVDPMTRLAHGIQADPSITLLWLGVNDARPGREIILSFQGGPDVTLPLDSPDNPAAIPGAAGVPAGIAPGNCVALELPRHRTGKSAGKPAFVPRGSNDVRIFPHAGKLEGVAIDPAMEVTVSYVDAKGRTYRFPKPVKLFSREDGSGGMFAAEIGRRDPFDPTPVLQITPAGPMSRIEVSGRADGPFVPTPEHKSVPTMNEIACGAVPFLAASRGSTTVWVRGTTVDGDGVAAVSIVVHVPPAVRWKTFEPASLRRGKPDADGVVELAFEPPDIYSDFYIDRIAFSPDGERLAAMMERAGLVVWDIKSRRQTHLVKTTTGKTLAFSADGSRLTNGLVVVDLDTATASPGLDSSHDTFGSAVSASLAVAASVDRHQRLAIYDFTSGAESAAVKLGKQHGFPNVVAISPDGALVGVAGLHVDVVWLVDRAAGKIRKQLEVPGTGVTSLAFSPDGTELLAVGPESCVRIWKLATEEDGAARLTLDDNAPEAMWTTKGIPLVADVGPAGLTVIDARTGKSVARVDGPVRRFAVSPTGSATAIAKKTSVVVRRLD